MTDEDSSISRRNVLAGLGTIGVGGALVGTGTSAFFSDKENFKGNELVAGELDLKIDWEEHYSDWSEDEIDGVGDWSMDPDEEGELFGFPSTAPLEEQSVFVENPEQFMMNTAIEAFPDTTKPNEKDYDAQREDIDDAICDLPADLDSVLSHPYRTRGTFGGDPNPQTTGSGDPLIMIEDVKPGDFGEVTLSFHLCGNPGFVWLTGELVDAAENGHTEPEAKDPDEVTEEDDPDVGGEYVELLDEIRAAFWYDTGEDGIYGPDLGDKDDGEGDNIFGPGERLLPVNGSLRSVLRALENEMFLLDPEPVSNGGFEPGENGDVHTVSGPVDGDTTKIDEIIVTGESERFEFRGQQTARNWQCADYEERLDQFETGDLVGSEIYNPDEETTYKGCAETTIDSTQNGSITLSSNKPVIIVSVKGGDKGENVYVFEEPVILDEATFETPGGQDISNVDVCCEVGDGNGDIPPQEDDKPCFDPSTTAYIGFEWWLPVDHANEIQTDSVEFNLGFYTEQCRHNDGSGMDRKSE